MNLARIDGATRLYGIVGHPITQVRSPEVMTAWLQQSGHNAILVPLHVLPEAFDETMRGLMRLGNLDGLVVTVPYKARALALAETCLPMAGQVGAINALRRHPDGRWEGAIFDGVGLVRALREDGFEPAGRRVRMLGAGGAGSAVAIALAEANVRILEIFDTDMARANSLVQRVATHYPDCEVRAVDDPVPLDGHDLLINCTPIGMLPGEGMPAPFDRFDPALRVVDIIMKPSITPLAEHARACGCRVMNGAPMLDRQVEAVMSFFMEHTV